MKKILNKIWKIIKFIKDICVTLCTVPLYVTLVIVLILIGLFELLKTSGGLTMKVINERKKLMKSE